MWLILLNAIIAVAVFSKSYSTITGRRSIRRTSSTASHSLDRGNFIEASPRVTKRRTGAGRGQSRYREPRAAGAKDPGSHRR